ncbi:DNA-deoxyinosine glycosylase [Hydrogenovibrio crunogenus]|uniref:DNA-deoxyinosine glycosylase n=1 Tax=Hydrogenovibrio crunogenus TaxID=39765 RepID=A0A4P7P228_9GAMM|nr:DNA-deoxyinosine glycosylase [Hydrogenovibrio crunogenus]QBZ83342.1 DNA-deoxyinosine glycosylase [Hydrogenovibrio crunogenus]
MSKCQGFSPIVPAQPKLLILGTAPSVVSLEKSFYYAHPRNAFWPILADYFNQPVDSVEAKKALCLENDILLWDVLSACERQGSLDSAIKQPEPNDFETLFQTYSDLKVVLFNGKAAQNLFEKQVVKKQSLPDDLMFYSLPSTSPANARLTFENKRVFWHKTLQQTLTK